MEDFDSTKKRLDFDQAVEEAKIVDQKACQDACMDDNSNLR